MNVNYKTSMINHMLRGDKSIIFKINPKISKRNSDYRSYNKIIEKIDRHKEKIDLPQALKNICWNMNNLRN